MELRVVRDFVDKGVPLQRVRIAADKIAKMFHTRHPFAHQRVFTDHEQVFVGLSEDGTHPDVLQITGRRASLQVIAGTILGQYLEEIDFDATTSLALRWFPRGRRVPIVLDPRVAFGAPVVTGTRIRTDVLAAYAAGNGKGAVARAFELHAAHVRAAVTFEKQLARAA